MDSAEPMASQDIPPEEVEKALRRIWRDAAKVDEASDTGPQHAPRLRTRLSNFVIVLGPDVGDGKRVVNELITDLCLLFPSRFFVVELEKEDDGESVRTSVSSRCVLGSSGQHVCSEEVFIRCGGGTLKHVTSLLRSLFVPDVSIISFFLGDPSAPVNQPLTGLLQQLREMCDLLLYDSQLTKNYQREVGLFLSLRNPSETSSARKGMPYVVRVRDLQWYRTLRLRMLLAEQFDTGRYRELVPAISKVRFSSARGATDPAAILLAGWISAVLGWKAGTRMSDGVLSCKTSKGKEASLEFVTEKEGFKVTLLSPGNEFSIEFDEEQMLFETAARVESSEKIVERRLTVPRPSLAELLVAPIQSSGVNDYFTHSLERSLDVAGALSSTA